MDRAGMKAAPDLKQVGARLNRGYMQNFIANPAAVHPGTTMPDVLASEPEEKRREISASISNYLLSLNDDGAAREEVPKADAKAGHELFHQVGCVACHSPRDEAGNETSPEGMVSLSHLPGKYRPYALGDFLFDPLKARPSGRMPDMNLTKAEAASIATYLEGESATPAPESRPPTADEVKAGKSDFKKYNCTACHQVDVHRVACHHVRTSARQARFNPRLPFRTTLRRREPGPGLPSQRDPEKGDPQCLGRPRTAVIRGRPDQDAADPTQLHRLPYPRRLWRGFPGPRRLFPLHPGSAGQRCADPAAAHPDRRETAAGMVEQGSLRPRVHQTLHAHAHAALR